MTLITVKFCSWRCESPFDYYVFTENRTAWTWPVKPSCDPVTHLVKYYPELRKTAKGNLTSNKETFFSAFCAPLHRSQRGINDQSFRRLSREFTTLWDGWNSRDTSRGHETDLFQWSIISCVFWFWQEFVFDEMLFNLFFGFGWRTWKFIWWSCSGKNLLHSSIVGECKLLSICCSLPSWRRKG